MNKEQFLTLLAESHGTDKLGHGYMPEYAKNLPDKCRSMLEIGIANGASALMWKDFYGADELDLHYIDLFLNPDFVSPMWAKNRGITPHIGDQENLSFLSGITDQFEVIIDDGSHNAQSMLISFKHLFVNNLVSGGTYAIEDLHCNKKPFYYGGDVKTIDDTPLVMFLNFIVNGKIKNVYFNNGESEVFENLIGKVEFGADNKIVFITKK